MTITGIVANGVIVPDQPGVLTDGARVEVTVQELPKAASALGQMLLKHAGKAQGLPQDLADQHDHYLHGTPKR
ncbi:MAG TPA: hypothetical protein VKS79_17240 [Gemmataceae bacterium]|nr:hypothetical protein [Gemmataceae bacterium]